VDLQGHDSGDAEGRLLYLAEHLAELHASADMPGLAGRFGPRREGARARSPILALPDGAARSALPRARPRPASARDAWDALGVDTLPQNAAATAAFTASESAGRPVAVRVAGLFPQAEDAAAAGSDAIVAPLLFNREFLGAGLFVVEPGGLAEQIAAILASHAAVALCQLREREEARRLHSVDPVLWVPDQHYLLDQLRREVNRARRYGREVGMALVRLENEPDIRARFGNFFTDHLLRRIGSQLLASVRDSDILGALDGGYAVIHTETSFAGTRLSAGRLADAVTAMIRQRFPQVPAPHISVHAASYPETAGSVEQLIAALTAPDANRAEVA
jgi:diguanylate cyclase (GGDEF)-like protein